MDKWEYMYVGVQAGNNNVYVVNKANDQKVQKTPLHAYSNWLGEQGWELIATLDGYSSTDRLVIFKRSRNT